MARIQVLPLTTESAGAVSATPFVVIIDKLAGDDQEMVAALVAEKDRIREVIGARTVFVYNGELTVENVDQALHDAAAAAVERVLLPERIVSVP